MMLSETLPFWLQNTIITGRDDGNNDSQDGDGEGDNGEDDGEEEEGEESGDQPSDSGDSEAEALRKALNEERKLRRKAEREARQAKKKVTTENQQEQQDLDEVRNQLTSEAEKNKRMAVRLLNKERDDAILAEARRQKFIDETDALTDDIRAMVEMDQDPDDPSDIEVDLDSVKKAVTQLANRKKHLIAKPNDGEPSGTRFGKKGGGTDTGGADQTKLQEIYPSLR